MSVESVEMGKFKRAKLTNQDVAAIAKLVATRKLTETEAALCLNIRPEQWFSWKSKNKRSEQFATLIARIKADKLAGLLDKIEAAGDDYEIELPNGKVVTKRGDWRAPAWIAERIDSRFAQQQSSQPPQPVINIGIMADTLKRIFTNEPMKVISDAPKSSAKAFNCDSDCEVVSEHGLDVPTPIKAVSAIKLPIRRTKVTE